MKKEELSDAIGQVAEDLVAEAAKSRITHLSPRRATLWAGMAACLGILTFCVWKFFYLPGVEQDPTLARYKAYAVSLAVYPKATPFPDYETYHQNEGTGNDAAFEKAYNTWYEERLARKSQPEGYEDGLSEFAPMRQFLTDDEENHIFSPLNVYIALGMLSEITDGNSRAQVLSLLNVDSVESLREKVASIWKANYTADGVADRLLANSLWLSQDLTYKKSTLDILAQDYYASSFRGVMGSQDFNELLRFWLNDQTKGVLSSQIENVEMNSSTVLALASTIYFQQSWEEKFSEDNTRSQIFHGTNGDVTKDFLWGSFLDNYYWGDSFGAVAKELDDGSKMWLILPDEGTTPAQLLSDGTVMDMIQQNYKWENRMLLKIELSMPKFDVSSDFDLIQGLKELGITDLFDASVSDFTPILENRSGLSVTEMKQAVRVLVDEDGCTAAAYTLALIEESAPIEPDEIIQFTLDRPFLFVITGDRNVPLFAGIVNHLE